jgi:putative FmdB family regulatory protein
MPTYEYQCPQGHVFEKLQKISEKPRGRCPVCGKAASRKISGGAGLLFKGSGFYITDYGKDGKGPRKPESEAGSSESKPGPEAKSDSSKPDAKPASGPAEKPAQHKGKGKAPAE